MTTIKPVTSLADLEFKAKTDTNYQKLAILGCKSLVGTNCRIKVFKNALARLQNIAHNHNPESCEVVISYVNRNCDKVVIVTEPETVCTLIKKKQAKKIVDNLKKIKAKSSFKKRPVIKRRARRV